MPYTKELPKWVQEVNESKPAARSVGANWMAVTAKPGDKPLCTMVKDVAGTRFCGSIDATPWGNELIEEMACRTPRRRYSLQTLLAMQRPPGR